MAGVHFDITGENKNFLKSLRGAESGVKNTANALERHGAQIEGMFNRIKTAAELSLAGFTVKGFAEKVALIRGEFQQLEVAFETMLGSADRARVMMDDLTRLAATTPFDLKGVADGAKQLLAYGMEADKVTDTLRRLGDISAGLGVNIGDLTYLYGTTMAQGRMYTQDLNQFTGRGIPMIRELAKIFGVAESKVKDLVTAGKVGFPEVEKVIMSLTNKGGQFGGLMEAQSKTIVGQISNLEDSFDMMFNEIGQSSQDIISGAISVAGTLVENYQTVGKVLVGLITTYGTYRAAVMTNIAITRSWAVAARADATAKAIQTIATKSATVAQLAFNAAAKANPYVLLATAAVAAGTAIWAFASDTDSATEAQDRYNKKKQEAAEAEKEHKARMDKLLESSRDIALADLDRAKALTELRKEYPKIFEQYNLETIVLADILKLKQMINDEDGRRAQKKVHDEEDKLQSNVNYYRRQAGQYESVNQKMSARRANQEADKKQEELNAYYRDRANQTSEQFRAVVGKSDDTTLDTFKKDLESQIKGQGNNAEITLKLPINVEGELSRNTILSVEQIKSLISAIDNQKAANKAEREAPKTTNVQRIADLKKAMDDANKAYDEFVNDGNSALTDEEYHSRLQDLKAAKDAAKKAYEDAGGVTGKKGDTAKKVAGEQKKLADMEDESALQRIRKAQDMTNRLVNVRLEAEEKNAETLKAQREQEHKEEIQSIERERDDAIRAYVDAEKKIFEQKEKVKKAKNSSYKEKDFDESSVDTSSIANQYNEIIDLTRQRQNQDIIKEQADALNEYLKEYGTFEQRKFAITQEYEEKIRQATTEGDKLALQEQMKSALTAVDTEALKRDIDWAGIFDNMGGMLYDEMRGNLEKLEEYMRSDEFMSLGATDQRSIADMASNMRNQIGGGKADFSKLGQQMSNLQGKMKELADAEEAEKVAKEEAKRAQDEYSNAVEDGSDKVDDYKKRTDDANANFATCSENVKELSSATEGAARELHSNVSNIVNGLNSLASGLQALKSGSLSSAFEGLKTTMSSLSTLISGKVGNALGKLANNLGGVVGQIIGAVLSVLDVLKDGISALVTSLLDTIFDAICGIIEDIITGKLFHEIFGSIIKGVGKIFDTLSFGALSKWGGGNVDEMEKYISELTAANELLIESIDGLSESIKDSDNTNSQSLEAYKTAVEAQKEWEQNQRNAIKARASEYSNTGHGFLGLGGKHSFNYYLNDKGNDWTGWSAFNEALSNGGYDSTVSSAKDIWELSPEEMKALRDFAPSAWAELLNTGGEANPGDLLNEYIDRAGVGEQLLSDLNEKLTGYSWDSFKDSYVSALADLDSTNENFAESLEDMLTNAIINSLVNDKYKDRIKEIYDAVAKAAEDDDITKDEIDYIRGLDESLTDDMIKERELLVEAGVLKNKSSAYSQEGSTGSFQNMGEETANELNGRFTAVQIHTADTAERMLTTIELLTGISSAQASHSLILSEIRNMMISTNGHLEDMVKYVKLLYSQLGGKLDYIVKNTKNL